MYCRIRSLTLAACAILSVSALQAQIDTGVLSGTVSDNTEAVVPGAEVVVLNLGTNYRLELSTNANGLYVSPPLPAGRYQISVALEGFQPAAKQVELNLADRLAVDFTLELGNVTEQVTVQAQGVSLQTERATLSTFRSEREVRELPVNDRNFAELMRYTPGAAPGQAQKSNLALSQQRGNTSSSVNGSSFADNNFVVDGVQNNSTHQGWGLMLFPEVEALDQYRVETSTPDARYGRSGATVNVGYKSGTNQFHGTLFHFFRNSSLDARNYFATGEKPALRRNFFGGVFSGPLGGKDAKTFFLVSYEGRRTRQAKTFLSDVPTPGMKNGDFTELLGLSKAITIYDPLTTVTDASGKLSRTPFPNNMIPVGRFNTAGKNVIDHYPDPNRPGLAANFLVNPSDVRDGDQYTVKVDRAFSGGSRGFLRFTQGDFDNIETRELGPSATPSLLVAQPVYQAVPSYTHVFSPTTINQTRLGVSYQPLDNVEMTGNVPLAEQYGIPGVNFDDFTSGLPAISVSGLETIGAKGCTPAVLHFTNYEVSNNTDLTRGNHSISVGFGVVRRQSNVRQSCNSRGSFPFSTIFTNNPISPGGTGFGAAELLLGRPQRMTIDGTTGTLGLRRSDWGFYIQDDWKIKPKLTLNLGLRYELPQDYPQSEVADRLVQFDVDTGLPVPVRNGRFPEASGVPLDRNNLAPRFGLAYRLTEKTVFRAGYGLYYSMVPVPVVSGLASQPPVFSSTTVQANQADFLGARALTDGPLRVNDPSLPGQNRVAFAEDFQIPTIQQWNAAIQHEVPGGQTLTVAYVGSKGTHLLQTLNLNQAVPGDGAVDARRRWPQHATVTLFQSAGSSSYHSLQTTLNKRFASGLNYNLAYTYSHFIDMGSQGGNGAAGIAQIPITNQALYKGNADQDLRHQFRGTFQYDLPFGHGRPMLGSATGPVDAILGGWTLNGAISIYTGFPYTVSANSNTLNIGEGSWADRIGNGTLPADQRTLQHWFDDSAFQNPGFRVWGNGGRNTLFGPGTNQWDFSVFKNFQVRESVRLQFRSEFFNFFNTPQFNNPNSTIGTANTGRITSAGSETTLQRAQRQIQFALKLMF
ncbi:MAG: hypothetical protein GC160_06985 [Acidobacteria bacterium]|nr:hypothetical protein [Acidobacteriota bacterium]